jgi:phosphate acetyltransferase
VYNKGKKKERKKIMFRKRLDKKFIKYAKSENRTIALPEAEFSGLIIKAAEYCTKKGIANIVLIGDEQKIKNTFLSAKFDGITFIDPKTYENTKHLARGLYELRKNKGLTVKAAEELILDPIYFATMLLQEGEVDGVVGGAATTTANMLRPAMQIIKTEEGIQTVSSSFIMISKRKLKLGDKGVFVMGDCAVNENPTERQLADIALATTKTARNLAQLEPRVAMLSYSTHASATGDSVKKVRQATKLVKECSPELLVEGEIQADAALQSKVARVKVKNNNWKGNANILIFPDLNSGNIGYKLMKIAGKIKAIGPIIQGLKKPVNDLSRGASLREIVLTIAITSLQASNLSEAERIERIKQEKLQKKLDKKLKKEQKRKKQEQEQEETQIKQEKQESKTSKAKKEEPKKEEPKKEEPNKEQKQEEAKKQETAKEQEKTQQINQETKQ